MIEIFLNQLDYHHIFEVQYREGYLHNLIGFVGVGSFTFIFGFFFKIQSRIELSNSIRFVNIFIIYIIMGQYLSSEYFLEESKIYNLEDDEQYHSKNFDYYIGKRFFIIDIPYSSYKLIDSDDEETYIL